jgi:hypothetical protein
MKMHKLSEKLVKVKLINCLLFDFSFDHLVISILFFYLVSESTGWSTFSFCEVIEYTYFDGLS